MAQPVLGEVRRFGFGFAPWGCAPCSGEGMSKNSASFPPLGAQHGGDGISMFGLLYLRGRIPCTVAHILPRGRHLGEAAHSLRGAVNPSHNILSSAVAARQSNAFQLN